MQGPSILAGLAPGKTAVLLPVEPGSFWPGTESYEWLIGDLRGSRVDFYGLALPFGVVDERSLIENPEVFDVAHFDEADARREATVRTQAWLDVQGPRYGRVVLVTRSGGPVMPIWSRAVAQHPVSSRVRLVPVHQSRGWQDTLLKRSLDREVRR